MLINSRLPDADMDLDDEVAGQEPKTNGANNAGNNINLASRLSSSAEMWPILLKSHS